MNMRDLITLVDTSEVTIPKTPVSGMPIGTVILLISGRDFDERRVPFLSTLDGWRQLDQMEKMAGRDDSLLTPGGETLADADLEADPRRKALVAKPGWPAITHLYQLEALPPGSVVMTPAVDQDDSEERRRMMKLDDGRWSGISLATKKPHITDAVYMAGYLGRYVLLQVG